MYEIILTSWYQDTPDKTYDEVYKNIGFDNIYDACEFLGKHHEEILEHYPAEKITIEYNHSRKKQK